MEVRSVRHFAVVDMCHPRDMTGAYAGILNGMSRRFYWGRAPEGSKPNGRRPKLGWGYSGGAAIPSSPARWSAEYIELPSGVWTDRLKVSSIFSTQDGLS